MGNFVFGCGDIISDELTGPSQTVGAVFRLSVMCVGIGNAGKLTGRNRELAKNFRRRNVNFIVVCKKQSGKERKNNRTLARCI